MKRKLILFLLAATPITSVQAGEEALVGAALHTAVAGKTVYVDTPMGEFPIRYSANGALSGRTELALLNGESTTSDHGRWWVADKQLCIQWRNWMEGRPHCFTMQKIGPKTIRWQGDDGKSGIARVG